MSKSKATMNFNGNILIYVLLVFITFYFLQMLQNGTSVSSSSSRGYENPYLPWRGNCDFSERFSRCLTEKGYNDKFTSSQGARINNAIHTECIFESQKHRQCPSVTPGVVR